ncbi:MAG TPA: 4Fe-4S dicluster domain-containing protein [Syntrophorhabdales bacterium]|nr:4Fe-4S dicluster domain-containing protein [Syntrophorhabdales bacterium]
MSRIGGDQPSGTTPDFSAWAEQNKVQDCFQCQKCSAGCPVVFAMDYKPNQVMQMVSLGMKERLLACKTIWVCASCYTCSTRCPNQINIAGVMDWLRQTALREGVVPAEKEVPFFHAAFLESIRSHGRVHELSMLARYKMKTHRYFQDMKLGWKMFARGKLRILPSNIKGRKEVAGLFTRPGP